MMRAGTAVDELVAAGYLDDGVVVATDDDPFVGEPPLPAAFYAANSYPYPFDLTPESRWERWLEAITSMWKRP